MLLYLEKRRIFHRTASAQHWAWEVIIPEVFVHVTRSFFQNVGGFNVWRYIRKRSYWKELHSALVQGAQDLGVLRGG